MGFDISIALLNVAREPILLFVRHSDHLAFFRRTLARNKTRNKEKAILELHLRPRDQQIQQARIKMCSKEGLRRKLWKICMSFQINVAPGSILYRFRGVTAMTSTIRLSWNFLCIIEHC